MDAVHPQYVLTCTPPQAIVEIFRMLHPIIRYVFRKPTDGFNLRNVDAFWNSCYGTMLV